MLETLASFHSYLTDKNNKSRNGEIKSPSKMYQAKLEPGLTLAQLKFEDVSQWPDEFICLWVKHLGLFHKTDSQEKEGRGKTVGFSQKVKG